MTRASHECIPQVRDSRTGSSSAPDTTTITIANQHAVAAENTAPKRPVHFICEEIPATETETTFRTTPDSYLAKDTSRPREKCAFPAR